jgi:hypothetical protein
MSGFKLLSDVDFFPIKSGAPFDLVLQSRILRYRAAELRHQSISVRWQFEQVFSESTRLQANLKSRSDRAAL